MKLKKKTKIIAVIISLGLIISIVLIYNIINTLKYRSGNPNEILYRSFVDSNISYNVYLKSNDFFDETYLNDDFSYITSLVEYIKTTFQYNFNGNDDIALDYNYYIKGEMVTNYMSDGSSGPMKPLWIKEYILLDKRTGHSKNSKINIDETLNIGLDFYNSLIDDFSSNTDLILDSRFDVSLIVNIRGNLPNDKLLTKDHSLTLSIPLGARAFDLKESKSYPEHDVIYSKDQLKVEVLYMISIIYIVLLIIVVWIVIFLIRSITNKDKNKYESRVNRLLKDYDDRIVTVNNFIRYEKLDVIDVSSFSELLTLSDETLEPIIHWEKKEPDLMETWFVVIKDRVLYRYAISYKK